MQSNCFPNPDKNSLLLKWINGLSTTCLSSHVKWEASHLLWGVWMLWCVKTIAPTAPTIIWWFIVILSVWASAFFLDLYFPAHCGTFLSCIFAYALSQPQKELSDVQICLRDDVNQEALLRLWCPVHLNRQSCHQWPIPVVCSAVCSLFSSA